MLTLILIDAALFLLSSTTVHGPIPDDIEYRIAKQMINLLDFKLYKKKTCKVQCVESIKNHVKPKQKKNHGRWTRVFVRMCMKDKAMVGRIAVSLTLTFGLLQYTRTRTTQMTVSHISTYTALLSTLHNILYTPTNRVHNPTDTVSRLTHPFRSLSLWQTDSLCAFISRAFYCNTQ